MGENHRFGERRGFAPRGAAAAAQALGAQLVEVPGRHWYELPPVRTARMNAEDAAKVKQAVVALYVDRARRYHRADVLESTCWGRAMCSCGWMHPDTETHDDALARAEAHHDEKLLRAAKWPRKQKSAAPRVERGTRRRGE